MSLGNLIGGMLQKGMSRSSHDRMRHGASSLGGGSDIERMLGSFLGGGRSGGASGSDVGRMASDFFGKKQAAGLSGAELGGIGAAAGAIFGGGMKGAVKGGAMALLGTMALKAWREHQASQGHGQAMPPALEAHPGEVEAMTKPETERLVLRAMIGAAQVDGHIDEAEMDRILGGMETGEVSEADRAAAREEASRPVDLEALGRAVDRPEVATEVYLGALMAVEIDTEAERDYFRRLARALRLEPGVVQRLHRMTGAPAAWPSDPM